MAKNNTSPGGIGFVGLLQVAFIVLKLTNIITWSWWAVLLPAEIGIVLFILLAIFMVFVTTFNHKL